MGDEQTLAYYEREAPTYVQVMAQGSARSLSQQFMAGFLPRLSPGSAILELGCGGGRDTLAMTQAGFVVDATDGAAAMAKEAEALTGQPIRVMRFDQLEADAAYDAVWAHASLHHQPLAAMPDVLARIARALKPAGLFFANYKLGQGDARDALGRLYNFPPREELLGIYEQGGWDMVQIEDYRAGGMDKVERDWIAITARRPAV